MFWIFVGVICASLYGVKFTHEPVSLSRSSIKTGATLCLLAAGYVFGAPWLLLVGLAFGAIGDAFLSRDHSVGFLPGLAAFLCGHLIYLYWSAILLGSFPFSVATIFASALLLVSGALLIKRWWPQLGDLKLPVLVYGVVSMCLAIVAIGFLGQGFGVLVATGILIFVLSDIILAEQLFMLNAGNAKYPLYASLLWALYWGGQLCILLGGLAFVH